MKIFTAHSVDTIRIQSFTKPEIVLQPIEQLISTLGLEMVDVPLEVDETNIAKLVCAEKDKFYGDIHNVGTLREAITGLDSLSATDERFWVSFLLFHAGEYVRDRWWDPKSTFESKVSAVNNHWFATSSRGFIRDQAASRLWWLGEYVSSIDIMEPASALEVLFWNSDLQSQFLGRPTVMSSRKVGGAILNVMKDVKDAGEIYDREKFRRLCSAVDLRMGRQLLSGLGHQQLDLEVRAIAGKLYPLP